MERRPARTSILLSVRILLVAITLFAVGPQFGSLDADGDGVPEVPIVILDVTHPTFVSPSYTAAFLLGLNQHQQPSIVAAIVSLFPRVVLDAGENIGRENISPLTRFSLQSSELLRC